MGLGYKRMNDIKEVDIADFKVYILGVKVTM